MAHPALFVNALALASEYLASYLAAQVAMVSQSADRRLARVLLGLSRAIGRQCENAVELDMNNQSLAEMANISPFTASRLLSQWQREGTVRKMRGKLLVQNPQRLMPD
jgi:CRP-like cAMP-binding protein